VSDVSTGLLSVAYFYKILALKKKFAHAYRQARHIDRYLLFLDTVVYVERRAAGKMCMANDVLCSAFECHTVHLRHVRCTGAVWYYGVLRSIFKNWNRRASICRRIFKPRANVPRKALSYHWTVSCRHLWSSVTALTAAAMGGEKARDMSPKVVPLSRCRLYGGKILRIWFISLPHTPQLLLGESVWNYFPEWYYSDRSVMRPYRKL